MVRQSIKVKFGMGFCRTDVLPRNSAKRSSSPDLRGTGRMKRSRYTEEQIIGILKEQEAGVPVGELCCKHATFYNWKSKYGGGLEVSKAKRLWTLEAERPSAEAAAS